MRQQAGQHQRDGIATTHVLTQCCSFRRQSIRSSPQRTLGSILTLLSKSTANWIPAFAGMTTLKFAATNGTVLRTDRRQQSNSPHILGYCSSAAAQLQLHDLQAPDRRRLPRACGAPGRLAVATTAQGSGYGTLLLGHAVNCCLTLREKLGVRVLVVDALDARAAAFYRAHGFHQTAEHALTLHLPLGSG